MQVTTLLSRHPRLKQLLPTLVIPILFAACGGAAGEQCDDPVSVSTSRSALSTTKLRLMGANISSGNLQSYDPGDGLRIFQGTAPDVVMLQEFNYGDNSASAIRGFVDTAFGASFAYYREGGAQIPNGVISRYPILDSGEWDDTQVTNRDFAWARIDIPGPKDLWAISVHLLTSSSGTRNTEASNLVALIKSNIPAGDYLVIGGDFNTDVRTEPCLTTFSAVVTTSAPYPADRAGNVNTNASRAKPYDHVLVNSDLHAYQTATVIGGSTFPSGLVVDTRTYSPISEIAPARSGDSSATNMQHMAVIKDFLIPGGTGTGGPGGVFINEVLVNEPGADVNGEFVELVNSGATTVDLSGWTLSDAALPRHLFPAGTKLAAGNVLVIFGGAAGIPAGTPNAVAATSGALGLSNSGDTVTLKDLGGTAVSTATLGAALTGTDGVSANRSPDASSGGSFVLHTTLSKTSASPGRRVSGAAF